VVLSGAALALALAQSAAAGVPAPVAGATLQAAALFGAGQAAGVVSAEVLALTSSVLGGLAAAKARAVTAVVLALALVGGGAAGWAYQPATELDTAPAATSEPDRVAPHPQFPAVGEDAPRPAGDQPTRLEPPQAAPKLRKDEGRQRQEPNGQQNQQNDGQQNQDNRDR
jgi:hypothetical protein